MTLLLRFFLVTVLCTAFSVAHAQLAAPTSLEASKFEGKYLKLDWSQVAGAAGYKIYRGTSEIGVPGNNNYEITEDGLIGVINDPTTTSFVDRGPLAGKAMKYCVVPFDGSGTNAVFKNCLIDSTFRHAVFASDSISDGYINVSWSVEAECLRASSEDIYLEIWDSTENEELYSEVLKQEDLPEDTATMVSLYLDNGDSILLDNSYVAPPSSSLLHGLGYRIAVDGNTALVSAIRANSDIGAVYVYEKAGGSWSKTDELTPSDGKVGDEFGHAIDIDGNFAVVSSNTDTGKAYIFEKVGANWIERDILMSNYPDAVDNFGITVAINNDQAFVGAPNKYFNLGVIYVFRKSGNLWPQYNMIASSQLQFGQMFGYSLDVDGNWLVAGAPGNNSGKGKVNYLEASGGGWIHRGQIMPGSLANQDSFGKDVSLAGARLIVGATGRSSSRGSVFFYERNASKNWVPQGEFFPATASTGDRFGSNTAIGGTTALVGMPLGNGTVGETFVYEYDGASWSQTAHLTEPLTAGDKYGSGIAVAGSELMIGAPGEDASRGALYIYEYQGGSWTQSDKIQEGGASPQSLEVWVKKRGSSSGNGVLFADDITSFNLNSATDDRVNLYVKNSGTYYFNYIIPENRWTRLSLVTDINTNTTKLYVNGDLIDELNLFAPIGTEKFGASTQSGSLSSLNAEIKDLRFWTKSLTAAEVMANFNTRLLGSETGLQGYWKMDEGTGTSLAEATGNYASATAYGSPTWMIDTISALISGSVKDWVGPEKIKGYSLTTYEIGFGYKVCPSRYDTGSTSTFKQPVISVDSSKPDSIKITWINPSDAISFYKVLRSEMDGSNELLKGLLDSTFTSYNDVFDPNDPNSLQNGAYYNYCLVPFSTRFGENIDSVTHPYDTACAVGTTYPINLDATDGDHPDRVVIAWNDISSFGDKILLQKDGEFLAQLDSAKTTYTDEDPLAGKRHNYSLQLWKGSDLVIETQDTGFVPAVGVVAGYVVTDSGQYALPGVAVQISGVIEGDTFIMMDTSGLTGDFRFENIYFGTGGSYELTATAPAGYNIINTPISYTFTGTDHIFERELVLGDKSILPDGNQTISLTNVNASLVSGEDKLRVSWNYSAPDTAFFKIYRNGQLYALLSDTATGSLNYYDDYDAVPGTNYDYQVSLYVHDSDTVVTETSGSDTSSIQNLTPVASLTATPYATQGYVGLTWTHTSMNIDGFYLYRDGTKIGTVSIDSSFSFDDYLGVPGTGYTYGIKAFVDKNGTEYQSAMTTATPDPVIYPALPAPSNVVATAVPADDKMIISWEYPKTSNKNFFGFKLVRNNGGNSDTLAVIHRLYYSTAFGTNYQFEFTDWDGVPGTNYTYELISWKQTPNYLSPVGSDSEMYPPVSSPYNFSASDATYTSHVLLTWNDTSENHQGYLVLKENDTLAWLPKHARSYIDPQTSSASPTEYRYWLSAYRNVDGTKYISTPFGNKGKIQAVSNNNVITPENFTASDNISNHVELSWSYPPYALSRFFIYKDGSLIDSVSNAVNYYYDTAAVEGQEYIYQVRAEYQGQWSAYVSDNGALASGMQIQGQASNVEGFGIPNTRISVEVDGLPQAETYTDSTGFYMIRDLPVQAGKTVAVSAAKANAKFTDPKQSFIKDADSNRYVINFIDTFYQKMIPVEDSVASPTSFIATIDPLTRKVQLTWNVSSGNFSGVKLYRELNEIADVSNSEPMAYLDEFAVPGNRYQYRLQVYWTKPEGTQQSEMVSAFINVPPVAPVVGLRAIPDSDEDIVKLYWGHPTDNHSYYEIKRNGTTVGNVLTGETLFYVDSTGLPLHNYKYEVTAVDVGPAGIFTSETRMAMAKFPDVAPTTDFELMANPSQNRVEIEWRHTSIYYSYAVIYRNNVPIDSVKRNEMPKQVFDYWGTPNDTAAYAVSSVVVKNGMTYESDTTVKKIVFPPILTPQISGAEYGINELTVKGAYLPISGYDGFELWRKLPSDPDTIFISALRERSTVFEFEDTDGLPDSSYRYFVRAYKELDKTYYSDFASIDTTFPSLAVPVNIDASDGAFFNHVLVQWEYNSTSNTGFIIYRNGVVLDILGSTNLNNPNKSGVGIRKYIDIINDASSQPDTLIYRVKAYKIADGKWFESALSDTNSGYALVQRFESFSSSTGTLANEKLGTSVSMAPNFGIAGSGTSQNVARTYLPDASNNFSLDTTFAPKISSGGSPAFGWDVVTKNNKVAISAPWAWDSDPNSYVYRAGEIYLYNLNNGNLTLDTILRNFEFEPAILWDRNRLNDTYSPTIVESNEYAPGYTLTYTARKVGQPDTATSGYATPFSSFTSGLEFTVSKNVRIDNVTVYAPGIPLFTSENIAVRIREVGGSTVSTSNYSYTVWGSSSDYQQVSIPVNTTLPPGDYVMDAVGTTVDDLLRNGGGGLSYPYVDPSSSIEITSATNNTDFYYYFYDWNISSIDTSGHRIHEDSTNYRRTYETSNFNVNIPNNFNLLGSNVRLEEVEMEMTKSGSQRVLIEDMTLVKSSGQEIELFSTNTSGSCPQNTINASIVREGGSMLLASNCTDPVTGTFIPQSSFSNLNSSGISPDGNYTLRYTVRLIDPDPGSGSVRNTLDATVNIDSINLKFESLPGGQFAQFLTKNSEMGYSVDLTGNTIAGGAPSYLNGDDRGLVTTFTIDTSGSWLRQDTLFPTSVDPYRMGYDLAIEGNKMLVGVPRFSPDPSKWALGYVTYYELGNDGKWTNRQTLSPSLPGGGDDQFGYSVAMDQGLVAVGAPGDDYDVNPSFWDAGAVELFKYNPSSNQFEHQRKITNPDDPKRRFEFFGESVAIKGNLMAIGAPGVLGNGTNVVGAVYIYEKDEEDNWVYKERYQAPDKQNGAKFGESVAISGNTVMVGAPEHDGGYGKVYFIYVREQIDSVIASDGTEGNKTRISWVYNGIRGNLSNFHIYRDDVLIAAADPNKSFIFDYDGIPGKKYVYSVKTVSLDNVEGAPKADKGWREQNGILDGSVVTQLGNVGVPNVNIKAWAHVEDEYFEYHTTTNQDGRFKIKRMYYADSTRFFVTASYKDHEIVPDTQDIEFNIQQYERALDPFEDRTAFVAVGEVKIDKSNCPIDSISVKMTEVFEDSSRTVTQGSTDDNGNFSFNLFPDKEGLVRVEFRVDSVRIKATAEGTDTVFFSFAPGVQQITNFNNMPKVTELDAFRDTTTYPVQLFVRNTCGPIGTNKWKIQIQSKTGCYSKVVTTDANGRSLVRLPARNHVLRVIAVDQPSEDNIPVIDYLKVRPRSLKLFDIHKSFKGEDKDTSFQMDFIFHITPTIEVTNFTRFLCDEPNRPVLVKQGEDQSNNIVVNEIIQGQKCHVTEGYLIIRNEAATKVNTRIDLDEKSETFPDYDWVAGEPNIVSPFIRTMVIEYHTEADGFIGQLVVPFIVEGIAAIPGTDIIVTPASDGNRLQLPLMILRDPPGDGSYSYIDSGQTFSTSLNVSEEHKFLGGVKLELALGVKLTPTFKLEQENGGGFGNSSEMTLNLTTNKKISTSPVSEVDNAENTDWLTGTSADVIVGAGASLQYGIAREIFVDAQCRVHSKKTITTGAEINTTWIYTKDQIDHLITENEKNLELAQQGLFTIQSKNEQGQIEELSQQETENYLNARIMNWKEILEYYSVKTLPHYALCDPANFAEIPEPWATNAANWRKQGFCELIGSYENVGGKEVFTMKPDSTWEWDTDLLNKYNAVREVVRDLENNYLDYPGGLTYSQSQLNNVKIDQGYNTLYGADAKNVTFSGGTSFSEDRAVSKSTSSTNKQFWYNNTKISAGIAIDDAVTIVTGVWGGFGAGVFAGIVQNVFKYKFSLEGFFGYQFNFEKSNSESTGVTETVGYELTDDDPGDQFSVTIVRGVQPTHTPYFDLFGGRASCPNEPGAIDRDIPVLKFLDENGFPYDHYEVKQADPDKPVQLQLQLTNNNQFFEGRWYEIYIVENSNPLGANIQVNGRTLSTKGAEEYFIGPEESFNPYVVFNRNPFFYDYEDIKIGMRPKCDPYITDVVSLDVHYRHPCSDISIIAPGNNWLLNSDTSLLAITLSDYNPSNDVLNRIQVVMRKLGSTKWDTIKSLSPQFLANYYDSLKTVYAVPTYPFVLDISDYPNWTDGEYEIMAIANCMKDGMAFSNRIKGTIDRRHFQLFGEPKPSDGLLSLGEEISVSFNKNIDCDYSMSAGYWEFRADSANGPLVSVQAACFGNKMIFEIDSIEQYEGRMIYAMLDSIEDANGNMQIAPVNWSFEISNNPIYWWPSEMEITVEKGENAVIMPWLKNTGLANEGYSLSDDQDWLTATEPNGAVLPGGKMIELTLNAADLQVGTYNATVSANIAGYTVEDLPVTLNVIKTKPNWQVDEGKYDHSVNVIANPNIDSVGLSTDTHDVILAYISGELRGFGNVQKVGANYYAAYITVYGNDVDDNKEIDFRVWDGSRGAIFQGHPESVMTFDDKSVVYGSTPDPEVIWVDTDNDSLRFIPLNQGWTWFSINTEMEDMSVDNVLKSLTPATGDVLMTNYFGAEFLKDSAQFNTGGSWIDFGIDSFHTEEGYMIHLAKADTLMISGAPAKNDMISTKKGWNLIGYQPQQSYPVDSAFLPGFPVPGWEDGDVIKSQDEFAVYNEDSSRWEGSLQVMKPYEAYKLKVGKPQAINYRGKGPATWNVNPQQYENTMRMVAILKIDGYELFDNSSMVSAYADNQCRGVGELQYVPEINRYVVELIVYGDDEPADLKFYIWDAMVDTVYECAQQVTFQAGKLVGRLSRPFILSPSATTGIQNLGADGLTPVFDISPNPFIDALQINFKDAQAQKYVVELYNGVGEIFYQRSVNSSSGENSWKIKPGRELASGMYYVTIKVDGRMVQTFKVVKE